MKKQTIKIILGLLLLISVVFVMAFSVNVKNTQVIGLESLEININVPGEMVFVNKEDVIQHLNNAELIHDSLQYEAADIETIEKELRNMKELKDIEVYKTLNGKLIIEASVREPIARVFTKNATSFYIDKNGATMPLSSKYTAHVLVFNGEIEQPAVGSAFEVIHNDTLKDHSALADMYAISSYVSSDDFLSSLITQVYVNNKSEYELIPRVGDFRIFLGNARNLANKMDNLKILYQQGFKNTGWNAYDSIYLKFDNQIVCSRKN